MRTKGFTLIELLVVIAILAGLVAILFPNFMDARARARDAQRKSDLKSIQTALEMYRQNQNPPSYPSENLYRSVVCTTWTDSNGSIIMTKVPADPLVSCSTGGHRYYYHLIDSLSYIMYACLENTSDPDWVVGPDNPFNFQLVTGYACATDKYYYITQP